MYNKWCWESWAVTCNRVKLDPYLTPYTKINSKWITNLQVRLETVKFLEENINGKFHDMSLGNNFLDLKPQKKATKAKINKWNYINIKRFCIAREIINEMKMQPTEWEKIFVNHISDKRLISKIGKNLYVSIGKNITQSN